MIRDNVDWLVRTAKEVAEAALPTAAVPSGPCQAIARVGEISSSVIRFARPPTAHLSPLMTSRSINYHYGAFQPRSASCGALPKPVGIRSTTGTSQRSLRLWGSTTGAWVTPWAN